MATSLATQFGITAKAVRDIWNLRTWAQTTRPCWTPADCSTDHDHFLAMPCSLKDLCDQAGPLRSAFGLKPVINAQAHRVAGVPESRSWRLVLERSRRRARFRRLLATDALVLDRTPKCAWQCTKFWLRPLFLHVCTPASAASKSTSSPPCLNLTRNRPARNLGLSSSPCLNLTRNRPILPPRCYPVKGMHPHVQKTATSFGGWSLMTRKRMCYCKGVCWGSGAEMLSRWATGLTRDRRTYM